MNRFHNWCWVATLFVAASISAQSTMTAQQQRQNALLLESQGRNAEARDAWSALLKSHTQDPEAMAHLGLLLARDQQYKEALSYYKRALAINPHFPGLRLNYALALFKGNQMAQAAAQFEILLKAAAPKSPEAERYTILLGMAYYGQGEYGKAAPHLQRAVDQDATSLPLLLALAQSYLWSRQFNKVLDVYHQILLINPNSAEADMLAGEALDQMKDNAGATQMFRDAIRVDPKAPNVHFGLGYLLWTQKRYPDAATEFQAELANDPNHVQSMLYLADADMQLNKPEAARPLLERVLKLDPSEPLAHLDMGILYTDAGLNEDALRELQIAEKMMPNDVNVHWRLGRLYRTLNRKEEAKVEFEKASSINKQVDADLYKKIAEGAASHPHPNSEPADSKQ